MNWKKVPRGMIKDGALLEEDFVEALKTIKPSSKADGPSLTNGKSLYQLEDSKARLNLQIYPTQPGDVEIGHRRSPPQLGYTNGKSLYQLEDSKAKFNSTQSENVEIRHRRRPPQLGYASATRDTQRSSPSKHFIPGNNRPPS